MSNEFHGRHVVVTGAGGALGSAVAGWLLSRGAVCHLPVRSALDPRRISAGTDRVHVADGVDLTDEIAVNGFYAGLPELWASIHCAGGFAMTSIDKTSVADLERMWAINARSAFLCCREAAGRIGPAGGRIVNVAARTVLLPEAGKGMVAYAVSKAAVAALTQSLAAELSDRDIRVNAVAPSIIDTPANRASMPHADPSPWPTPEQIAEVIGFLASPANTTTTGAVVPV